MTKNLKWIWITNEILLNKNLNLNEKVILAQIQALSGKRGCFASNDYFWDLLNISKSRVSVWINSLIKKWYVYSEYTKTSQRVLKISNQTIYENENLQSSKPTNPYYWNRETPLPENNKYNILFNNNIYNKYWKFKNVSLSDSEYSFLLENYGSKNLEFAINKLDKWIESKWYTYDNYYETIISWLS